MSRLTEREVARRLAERVDAEPPAGLLAKIKSEIPPELSVGGGFAGEGPGPRPAVPHRRLWLMAASLAAMVGAGLVGYRVMDEAPLAPSEEAEELAGAPAAQAPLPPAAPPEREADAAAQATVEEAEPRGELKSLGYALGDREDEANQAADQAFPGTPPPPPPAPSREELRRQRNAQVATQPAEIAGGVEGGVAGGVVGGVPGGEDREFTVTNEALLLSEVPAGAFRGGAPKAAPSTGGTAEPNGQPYGDVFFKSHGVNPFVDTEEDALSTFGLDVDSASYTVARSYLAKGHLPPPEAVRVEEMVNFFDYGDRPPARGDFALRAEGAPTPFASDRHRLLRFGIRGREVKSADRKPAVVTFVVDVSGSMDQENRLGLVQQALGLLLDELRASDRVGLVVYGSEGRVLLEPTAEREAIRRAIGRLVPEGSTNAEEGLALGYDMASRHFRPGAINRVILCSDGVANVGLTGASPILERIGREARRGIELTTVGFGMGNYNDVLMEQLADRGDGRYAYVDTLEEARRIFVEDLTGTLQTIASDAKVQVEFDPEVVERWRLLGYENRDVADERFRDDSVDAGEIGAGHGVTALYEVKLRPDAHGRQRLATLRLRYRSAETEKVHELERHLEVSDLARSWEAASPALRLASLVAEYAELLRGSYWAREGSLDEVFRRAQRLSADWAGRPRAADVAELASLAGKAARLAAEAGKR